MALVKAVAEHVRTLPHKEPGHALPEPASAATLAPLHGNASSRTHKRDPNPMKTRFSRSLTALTAIALPALLAAPALAGEADLKVPSIDLANFKFGSSVIQGNYLMMMGLLVCILAAAFGWLQYAQTKALPVHKSMAAVSNIIWETCKSYLFQQGKFLAVLWVLIGACMLYYFGYLEHKGGFDLFVILASSVLGILGSYGVAWFGIRINTTANSRAAFASLKGEGLPVLSIPLRSGMSVGLLLVSVELFFMIVILKYLPANLVGPAFIGFAIGESLGASALRICGGIFTKIADIGSDLMKIVFKLPEDDPKNPGVIADCTGDNAGDSVGPTADGFETYGVTGVALIAFLALALGDSGETGQVTCAKLIVWLFTMRALMIITSLLSYFINEGISKANYSGKKEFHEEAPLTWLVWITSIVSIAVTFLASWALLGQFHERAVVAIDPAVAVGADGKAVAGAVVTEAVAAFPNLWWILSLIISCGTLAGALIPEFTKVFTSTTSRHVREVENASSRAAPA